MAHSRLLIIVFLIITSSANAVEFVNDEYLSCPILTTTSLKYSNLQASSYSKNGITTTFSFTGQMYNDVSSLVNGVESTILTSYQASIANDVVITYQAEKYYAGNTNTSGKLHFTYNVSSVSAGYSESLHYHYIFFTYECLENVCPDGFPSDLLGYTGCDRPYLKQCSDNSYALQTANCPVTYTNQECDSETTCLEWSRIQGNCNLDTDTYSFNYTDPDNLSFSCTTVATNPDPDPDPNPNPTLAYISVISDSAITQAIEQLRQQVLESATRTDQRIHDETASLRSGLQFTIETSSGFIRDSLSQNRADAVANADRIINSIAGLNNKIGQLGDGNTINANNIIDSLENLGAGSVSVDLTSLESKTDTSNQLLTNIKDNLTTTAPTGEVTDFPDSETELNAKKQEFSDYLNTQTDRVTALFDINNISFAGAMPDMSFQILNNTFTVDTTWIEYILVFLGVLVVLWAYYDALIIVLGG